MEKEFDINGLLVRAVYSDRDVEELFVPLLRKLTALQKKRGRRILVFLAAPPAAGKSTLAAFWHLLSREREGLSPLTVIGMDGFHRRQDDLLSHTTVRDGEEIPLVRIKGAPVTFDLPKLAQALASVSQGEICGWPVYSRPLHNPVEDAVRVEGSLVLLEGNYLLLDEDGWRDLRAFADFTIRITAPEEMLRERLIRRRMDLGETERAAVRFVDYSDMPNVRLCLEHSLKADLALRLSPDGTYRTA